MGYVVRPFRLDNCSIHQILRMLCQEQSHVDCPFGEALHFEFRLFYVHCSAYDYQCTGCYCTVHLCDDHCIILYVDFYPGGDTVSKLKRIYAQLWSRGCVRTRTGL
jgi:hypothetical protein